MKKEYRWMLGRGAVSLGLFAAAVTGGGRPFRAFAATDAAAFTVDWAESSGAHAQAMIKKYGTPNRHDDTSLTWFGLFGGKRTIIYRKEPGARMIEQAVFYRVPAKKVGDLKKFDSRITIERQASELSVRTDSIKTNFLVLNLAHEISSGFKTIAEAIAVYDEQMLLADDTASRYRDSLLFLPAKNPR